MDFENSDIDELLELYRKHLNDGEKLLSSMRKACERGLYFGSKAVEDNVIKGIFTFQRDIVFTYPHPDIMERVMKAVENRETVTVDSLLVLPEMRGQGIARSLSERNKELLRKNGNELVLAESWIYPDGRAPSLDIYENMGKVIFKEEVPMFYSDSNKYGISCPICGEHCKCGANILLIDIT